MSRILWILLLCLTMSACNSTPTPTVPTADNSNTSTSSDSTPVPGGASLPTGSLAWQGSEGDSNAVTVKDPARYQIIFNADGSTNIVADCNQVNGSYAAKDGMLDIALGPSTLVGCPPDSQDSLFLRQLDAATGYRVEGDSVMLLFPDNGGAMRFAPIEGVAQIEVPLAGTTWTIVAYTDPATTTATTVLAEVPATITFDGNGNFSSNTGCNILGGSYTLDGQALTMMPATRTEVACDEATTAQENQIIAALSAADTLVLNGNQLELRQGDTLLIQAATER